MCQISLITQYKTNPCTVILEFNTMLLYWKGRTTMPLQGKTETLSLAISNEILMDKDSNNNDTTSKETPVTKSTQQAITYTGN